MSKRNTMPDYDPVPSQRGGASRPPKKKKKKGSGLFGRIVRRFFLVLFTVIALILVAACLAANLIFNGPSPGSPGYFDHDAAGAQRNQVDSRPVHGRTDPGFHPRTG